MNMGVVGSLKWANRHSRKQCRSFLKRLRAAVKNTVKNGKKQSKFQYDPSSYALNFDDGYCNLGSRAYVNKHAKYEDEAPDIIWVYVVWRNPDQ